MRTLTTVDEVVDALGGTSAAARHLGVTPAAVSNWRAARRIPGQWHKLLRRDFLDRDMIIDDSVFDDPAPSRRAGHTTAA
jgi:hypothetical protein